MPDIARISAGLRFASRARCSALRSGESTARWTCGGIGVVAGSEARSQPTSAGGATTEMRAIVRIDNLRAAVCRACRGDAIARTRATQERATQRARYNRFMDPVSHAALGASFGQSVARGRAVLTAALAAA